MKDRLLGALRSLSPRMAGDNIRERLIACVGALVGIGLTGVISGWVAGAQSWPFLVAPLGASAVLLFAVPASPLAQPWSIIGGNTISALAGIVIAHLVPAPVLAAPLAVAVAIAAMAVLRCLHPPGGAASLLAVLGGPASAASGFGFMLMPVALNSLVLVLLGVVFHRLSGHAYPHRPKPVPPMLIAPQIGAADIDAALAELGEPFDISREDLLRLLRRAELAASQRLKR